MADEYFKQLSESLNGPEKDEVMRSLMLEAIEKDKERAEPALYEKIEIYKTQLAELENNEKFKQKYLEKTKKILHALEVLDEQQHIITDAILKCLFRLKDKPEYINHINEGFEVQQQHITHTKFLCGMMDAAINAAKEEGDGVKK